MRNNKNRNIDMDLLFQEGVQKAAEIKGKALMKEVSTTEPYQPTAQFDRKMKQLIRTELGTKNPEPFFKRHYLGFSKASAPILVALLLLMVVVPNVAAARNWVTKLVIEANPEYATYYLKAENQQNEPIKEIQDTLPFESFYPSYLPEGMKLTQLNYDGHVVLYQFEDDSKHVISIEILGSGSAVNMDNQDLDEQSTESINGVDARYTRKLWVSSLIWMDKDRIFVLSTNLPKEEAIRIGNGLTRNK
jgi:hypothetical protein